MKKIFKKFENWLEKTFCDQNDCYTYSRGGGRKNGMTDSQRNEEGDGKIPTFKQLFNKKK